ncbi:hypothetical protein [Microbacterium aurantiacum]|uniref:Uncharacterized protein n=1 Tax=Microbacterium aurantiacum TaxID=162393 RepID=A0ABT8FVR6_9MICO|nr:hypothetical protein [Microbacterium aurantiacum]MDN4465407.1 hypothetical protein [Microbacterium aurantiacum]
MSDALPSDDERAARLAAQRKAWNDAHPTYYAEYRERNREDIRRKNRERERAVRRVSIARRPGLSLDPPMKVGRAAGW